MASVVKSLVILVVIHCPFLLAARNSCQLKQGLPCNSTGRLVAGSSLTIASKTCRNGKYPKNQRCAWYFEVDDCKPTLTCQKMALKGKGKRCKGDGLIVETENRKRRFCRKNQTKNGFTDEKPTSFFDVKFKTNNREQGPGFQCTVSCSGKAPTTSAPPSSDCKCGVANRKTRIVGGTETKFKEYPWQVAIKSPDDDLPFCGGAILSSDTILTAAHCTFGEAVNSFKVIVNEHDVLVDDGKLTLDVCSKKEHTNYDSDTTEHDLAILTLCQRITFTETVSPVCLPDQSGDEYDDVQCTVTGWGSLFHGGPQSNVLMGVNVTTIGNSECDTSYGGGIIKDSMICAKAPGKDACQGDSGGPLVMEEPGDFYSLIGIVSFATDCASPDFPGVYARVTEDLAWIRQNIGGRQCSNTRKLFTRQFNDFDEDED